MAAKIPAHVREQQINELPNISFVRWEGAHINNKSKAVCRCDVDGFEWVAQVNSLLGGRGCPQCARVRRWTAEERIEQINAKPNIQFVRWESGYKNSHSKVICRCLIDGFEWATAVSNLLKNGYGCPQCAGVRRWTAEERIEQINAKPNIQFVRWESGYKNCHSKAVCRCLIDGFEWAVSPANLIRSDKGTGCPQCSNVRKWTAEERIAQINALQNISFVRWESGYRNHYSKAVCRCAIDGVEWAAAAGTLIHDKTGCPQCAKTGYDPSKSGTLYVLRSECGAIVKIGISNDYKTRHTTLRRTTPFNWSCIELLHSADGSLIAEWERELHSWTEPATFRETFDGYTEWRKWDDRLPRWLKRYRARLERYNKAP